MNNAEWEPGTQEIPPPAGAGVSTSGDYLSCFHCVIAARQFALAVNYFCEVINQALIAPLPGTAEHFLGLCNLRGELVPVYQLHGLLAKPLPMQKTILVIGRGDKSLGLVIDKLPMAMELTSDPHQVFDATRDPPLAGLLPHLPHRIVFHQQNPVCCLDAEGLGTALRTLASGTKGSLIHLATSGNHHE